MTRHDEWLAAVDADEDVQHFRMVVEDLERRPDKAELALGKAINRVSDSFRNGS